MYMRTFEKDELLDPLKCSESAELAYSLYLKIKVHLLEAHAETSKEVDAL